MPPHQVKNSTDSYIMDYTLMILLFLSGQLIVALAVANHYQTRLDQRLKAEYDYKLLIQEQLDQLEKLQQSHQVLLAENKSLRQQDFQVQRKQFLASLN